MSSDETKTFETPARPFPVLPARQGVLFPGTGLSLQVGRKRSVALLKAVEVGDVIGVAVQRDPRVDDPVISDLLPVGTFARVREVVRLGRRGYHMIVEGLGRFHLDALASMDPFLRAEGRPVLDADADGHDEETHQLARALLDAFTDMQPSVSSELRAHLSALSSQRDPGLIADAIASTLGLPGDKEAEVLLLLDVKERLRLVHRLIAEAGAIADVRAKIDAEVRERFTNDQREAILRQQLRAIQKELGEGGGDGEGDELSALGEKLAAVGLPDDVQKIVDRELTRLKAMNPAQAEHAVVRNYLELISELPWSARAEVSDDIDAVATQLDEDHYALEEVKKRVLEHLAVRKVTGNNKGTILCLVGPPGVGKTSLASSVAEATGRPFVRVALGGVRDEADIRGHRRTYVGAMAGRVISALRKVEAKNPVFLLDEIDKLGRGWLGSPEAALLEVLDPEQNSTFTDHYLDLPFDLSEVMFICTANTLDTLSPPLRDRMEIVELSGYTHEEKFHIARNHLVPERLADHGLDETGLRIGDGALKAIVTGYTREAGVRQLGREITRLCRALTLKIARDPDARASLAEIGEDDLHTYLGRVKFFNDVKERTAIPGVATGLAWTPVGGDVLFVETSRMPGKGHIEITGQLGDVMKESARAALSYIRSNAERFGVEPRFLESQDLHIHVPAGAVPKDGPSAGVTMFTALTSLMTGRRVRPDTAMTGECTLRGRVLPVGGIRNKVLAAHRMGITRIILPKQNARDLDEVPEDVRDSLELILAEDMSEVLEAALVSASELLPTASGSSHGVGVEAPRSAAA